jgi:hypothetical protein
LFPPSMTEDLFDKEYVRWRNLKALHNFDDDFHQSRSSPDRNDDPPKTFLVSNSWANKQVALHVYTRKQFNSETANKQKFYFFLQCTVATNSVSKLIRNVGYCSSPDHRTFTTENIVRQVWSNVWRPPQHFVLRPIRTVLTLP